MKNEIKTRREAIKLLGRTGLFLGAVPVFFTSLNIHPAAGSESPDNPGNQRSTANEKATISGSGNSLTVNVSGRSGRVFFVTFALNNVAENYRRIPGSDGVISTRGTGKVTINTASIPSAKVFLKVITGEANNTSSGISETEPVVITFLNGKIQAFEGTVTRPLAKTEKVSSQILIAMAASSDNKIILR